MCSPSNRHAESNGPSAREPLARQPEEQLRDAGAAARDVRAGQRLLDLARERVRGLELAREAHREAHDVGARVAEPGHERLLHPGVEGVVLRPARPGDLVHRREAERRAVCREVELERVVRGGHDAERRLDRRDRAGVGVRIVEGVRGAERGLGEVHRIRDGVRVAARAGEGDVLELACVRERGAAVELAEARLEAVAEVGHALRREQRVEGLDVRVDGQDLHAVRAEEARQHRHREVRGRGIAGRRINERDAHSGRRSSTPGGGA